MTPRLSKSTQFITLAGWHALNLSMFELAKAYRAEGMYAYSLMQEREFANQKEGFRAVKHQAFVGTGYFDAVQTAITSGKASTTAMRDSTERAQFETAAQDHAGRDRRDAAKRAEALAPTA